MDDTGANSHSLKSTVKAAGRKFWAVPFRKKMKLVRKLFLRFTGAPQKLYLEGYYDEDADSAGEDGVWDTGKKPDSKPDRQNSYIALVSDTLDKGGLEQVIRLLANEWKKSGRDVRVLCMKDGGEIATRLKEEDGIEVLVFHSDLEKLREYLLQNPPLVANTHFLHEGIEVFYHLGIPIVEVIHNMYVFLDYNQWCFEKKKSEYAGRYIAVSECAKDIFLKKAPYVSEDRVSVIGNAFNTKRKTERVSREDDRIRIRKELGIPEKAFVFLSVGSIDPRKNNLGMVQAFSELVKKGYSETYLVMVGQESDQRYAKKVRKLTTKKKVSDRVLFTGQRNDVDAFLNASDAFLMISYYEGWSVAATEALSEGLPLIHSECGSASELIAGGKNGILVKNPLHNIAEYDLEDLDDAMYAGVNESLEEIITAMQSMIKEEAVWKRKRKEITGFAESYLNTREVAKRYEDVFENAVKTVNR